MSELDQTDRDLINLLQDDLPLTHRPFAQFAVEIGLSEGALLHRIIKLRESGVLTRFGPFFDVAAMGGDFCLCAMAVPKEDFNSVAVKVNARHQVAHNYERTNRLNMWFVLACETLEEIGIIADEIEKDTGYPVLQFPKMREFFVGFRVAA